MLVYVMISLALIFYSEVIGNYVGPFGRIWIGQKSPPQIIEFLGWVMLLLPLISFITTRV